MSGTGRADRLRARFDELKVDAVLLSSAPSVRYLTGFSGEGGVVVDGSTTIVTDGRYTLRASREAPGIDVVCRTGSLKDAIVERVKAGGATRVGFEADQVTVSLRDDLRRALRGVTLVPLTGILRHARMLKDATEIKLLRRAIALTDRAFGEVVPALQIGMTEREAALEVERQLRLAGADALSFPTIAAFGPNSADPHAEPTNRKLKATDNVKLDFGGQVKGYHADLTRTVFLREPSRKQARIYGLVLEAQQRAIAACRPGALARDVDTVARGFLKNAGFGDAFTHGLGHGVGLEVHEGPGLAQTSTDVLAPGMVVTVEPGIYLRGWGGVRIEDVVLITERGHEVLTKAPK